MDPEDGKAQTLDEMMLKYKGVYSKSATWLLLVLFGSCFFCAEVSVS